MEKIRVLNSIQFKYLLAIMMVLNHIYYIFEFTGRIPELFELVGYCVAPCFLLFMIDGFQLTSNRKKYYSRLWFIAAAMGLVLWLFNNFGFAQRSDGFVPENGIISNFLVLFVLMLGIEHIQAKRYIKGCMLVIAPFIWGAVLSYSAKLFPETGITLELIHAAVFPNVFWLQDGGISYVFTGVVAYLLRKNRYVQIIASMLSIFIFIALQQYVYVVIIFNVPFSPDMIFNKVNLCAVLGFLPMLFYNGKKGKGSGRFFYYFYPLHIYVLYACSGIVYDIICPGNDQFAGVVVPMIGIIIVFSAVFFIKDNLLSGNTYKNLKGV